MAPSGTVRTLGGSTSEPAKNKRSRVPRAIRRPATTKGRRSRFPDVQCGCVVQGSPVMLRHDRAKPSERTRHHGAGMYPPTKAVREPWRPGSLFFGGREKQSAKRQNGAPHIVGVSNEGNWHAHARCATADTAVAHTGSAGIRHGQRRPDLIRKRTGPLSADPCHPRSFPPVRRLRTSVRARLAKMPIAP